MSFRVTIYLFAALVLTVLDVSAEQTETTYCAFEITVKSPRGIPISGTAVSAHDQSGATVGTSTTREDGAARICDVPAGLIDIRVGDARCGAVTVHYLKPYWLQPRRVFVTYEDCSGADHIPPSGCRLTIRVSNNKDEPLAGVVLAGVTDDMAKQKQTRTSDQFGRIFRFIEFGRTFQGTLLMPGFISKEITEDCRAGEAYQKHRTIVLDK